MALTLNEFLKEAQDNGRAFEAAILSDMLRQSKLLQLLPIKSVSALRLTGTRWQTLPAAANRKIGGVYTEGVGATEEVESTLALYGGEILVDRILTKIKAKEAPLTLQSKMKVAALTALFNYDFINGDTSVNPDGMEGVSKLISNEPARMTIDLATSGSGLAAFKDTASEHLFIDGLHEAYHKVGGDTVGGDIVIICNEKSYLGVSKVLRRANVVNTTRDVYDRIWTDFLGAKILDIGVKSDLSTEIISNTETPTGGVATDCTSVYVCRLSGDDGLRLCQLNGTSPEPYDPLSGAEGGLGANPGFVRRIDWAIGLQQIGRYACARIKGVKFSAS